MKKVLLLLLLCSMSTLENKASEGLNNLPEVIELLSIRACYAKKSITRETGDFFLVTYQSHIIESKHFFFLAKNFNIEKCREF